MCSQSASGERFLRVVELNTTYSVVMEVINYRLYIFTNHYSKVTYIGINQGKNLDFQQLIRILKVCLGLIHVGTPRLGKISLNHLGCLVVKD